MLTENDEETTDALNAYFANVSELEGDQDLPNFPEKRFTDFLSYVEINEDKVQKAIL